MTIQLSDKVKKRLSHLIITYCLLKQKLKENFYIIEFILTILVFVGFFLIIFRKKEISFKLFAQVHRSTRWKRLREFIEPFIKRNIYILYCYNNYDEINDKSLIKRQIESCLGNRIMVLKWPENREKGVLLIKFSELFSKIPIVFDMEELLRDYKLILEPSWSGYCNEDLLRYTQYNEEIYIMAPEEGDFEFISRLNSNLIPLPFGPCDWVDDRLFEKYRKSNNKIYDVIMNVNCAWYKRHHILFKTLKKLFRNVKVALISATWQGRTINDIKLLARYYGVDKKIDFFTGLSYPQVIKITSMSKIGILLSLKEGSNKAIAECLMCDVPVIVLSNHIGGIKKNINRYTGKLVDESRLSEEIEEMLDNLSSYSPRNWAKENISCVVTTERLNSYLKNRAITNGEPWTRDIVIKTNSPEPKYYYEIYKIQFKKYNIGLKNYFKI
jgi:hypothetical protein